MQLLESPVQQLRIAGLLVLTAVLVTLAGCAPADDSPYAGYRLGQIHPQAPEQVHLLTPLIGVWHAERTERNRDGTWPEVADTQADWIWFYILDGYAVEDDWIAPPLSQQQAVNRRTRSSVRVYDEGQRQWTLAQNDGVQEKSLTFDASSDNGDLFLVNRESNGRLTRDHFYNIGPDSFDWMEEWTADNGEDWTPVARVHATRIR